MSKGLALLFAVVSVLFLVGISAALSFGRAELAALSALGWVLFSGFGFAVKARMRRRATETESGTKRG